MTDAVSRGTAEQIDRYVTLVIAANEAQNLIARSTVEAFHQRHIVDSLQLLPHAPHGTWLDIGSGAGLPGMVIAMVRPEPMTLMEPRAKRASFLRETAAALGLSNVAVIQSRAETANPVRADIISARAVADLAELFAAGARHATPDCVWLLHKGKRAAEDLARARQSWQGDFSLIPSVTDPESFLVMARNVRPIRPRPETGRRR